MYLFSTYTDGIVYVPYREVFFSWFILYSLYFERGPAFRERNQHGHDDRRRRSANISGLWCAAARSVPVVLTSQGLFRPLYTSTACIHRVHTVVFSRALRRSCPDPRVGIRRSGRGGAGPWRAGSGRVGSDRVGLGQVGSARTTAPRKVSPEISGREPLPTNIYFRPPTPFGRLSRKQALRINEGTLLLRELNAVYGS